MIKSKFVPTASSHTANKNEVLLIFCTSYTSFSDAPATDTMIVINDKMELNVYAKSAKLNKIKDYPLPAFIDSTSAIYSIVDAF